MELIRHLTGPVPCPWEPGRNMGAAQSLPSIPQVSGNTSALWFSLYLPAQASAHLWQMALENQTCKETGLWTSGEGTLASCNLILGGPSCCPESTGPSTEAEQAGPCKALRWPTQAHTGNEIASSPGPARFYKHNQNVIETFWKCCYEEKASILMELRSTGFAELINHGQDSASPSVCAGDRAGACSLPGWGRVPSPGNPSCCRGMAGGE